MAINADQIGATIQPYIGQLVGYLYIAIELLAVIGAIVVIAVLFTYNIKVFRYEYTKGGRVIASTWIAKEITDKKTGSQKLKFFHPMNLIPLINGGKLINCPSNECLLPFRGRFIKRAYCFVVKDGLYHPISNFVLGKKVSSTK